MMGNEYDVLSIELFMLDVFFSDLFLLVDSHFIPCDTSVVS